MRAGRLDRRVRFLRFGAPVDTGMAHVPGDTETLYDCAAQFMPGRGSERRAMAETVAFAPVTWRVRWCGALSDLSPDDRLIELKNGVPTGPEYDIHSVVVIGRREGLEITAVARAMGTEAGRA